MTAPARPLPCPFCGGRKPTCRSRQYAIGTVYRIECAICFARAPEMVPGMDSDGNWTRADAVRAWNTRSGK